MIFCLFSCLTGGHRSKEAYNCNLKLLILKFYLIKGDVIVILSSNIDRNLLKIMFL